MPSRLGGWKELSESLDCPVPRGEEFASLVTQPHLARMPLARFSPQVWQFTPLCSSYLALPCGAIEAAR